MVSNMRSEMVVLVDEKDKPIGKMDKYEVHSKDTPLHRGFSMFVFDDDGKLLVQRRAMGKKTWPGTWSNSCCGHPMPGEAYEEAVKRRVKYELGIELLDLKKVSDYRYKFERGGVVENEICPVYMGKVDGVVRPNPEEVMEVAWLTWDEFNQELADNPGDMWSEWCREEAELVAENLVWRKD